MAGLIKKITAAAAAVAVMTAFTGCSDGGYKAEKLITSNTDKGWECIYSSLDGEYTNTFPINSRKLKITSEADSGSVTVKVENAMDSVSFDGTNGEKTIDMSSFGEGTVYITFDADKAQNGSMTVVWVE